MFCFTDAPLPRKVGNWRAVRIGDQSGIHPRMRAKYFKLLSHRVFPEGRLAPRYDPLSILRGRPRYDATVWIDGSIQVESPSFVREFLSGLGPSGWVMFRHPDRDCIFEEARASRTLEKYDGQPLEEQARAYAALGMQRHAGLYACTVIGRKEPLSQPLKALNEAWWAENHRWTYQDQISLPVLLKQMGLALDTVTEDLWENGWFTWVMHRRPDR
jgi:hypothetical protein